MTCAQHVELAISYSVIPIRACLGVAGPNAFLEDVMDEQAFREQVKRDGYGEPELIEWDAGTVNDTHTHDFAATIYVLSGEITVATDEEDRTCRAGDTGSLGTGVPHTERIGPDGVTFLVARK